MSRVGNFTSSQVYRLMSKGRGNFTLDNVGAPFHSYIKDKVREIRTGRPIQANTSGRATEWGNYMEEWLFINKLGLNYMLVSKTRYSHKTLPWSGMPDLLVEDLVGDIKNPWTINSFCDAVDSFISVEEFKKVKPEYYWQLVSNCILCDKENAEIIVHIPYQDELQAIRESTGDYDGDQNKIAFINWGDDSELPYIVRDNHYKDLNHFKFKVSPEDKELLTQRITMAAEILKKELAA